MSDSEDKKILIDEDWKTQVRAEKDALQRENKSTTGGGTDSSEDPAMPPASLEMLLSSLTTEALIALGQIPHPATGETIHLPNQAKYLIDTISVLQEKTAGNLSPIEAKAIEDLLHQLRMAFVAGPTVPKSESSIVTP